MMNDTAMHAPPSSRRISPWLIWGIVVFVMGGLLVGYNYMLFYNESFTRSNQMPPVQEVPGFALQDQTGTTVTKQDFFGEPWVANFIFTRCPGPCGLLSERMQVLQERLPESVRLVSFTVDPEFDTPMVLSDYAAANEAREGRWFFLTGNRDIMRHLITKGFRLTVAENDEAMASEHGLFMHSTHFVLVDGRGMIRRYYQGTEAEALEQLENDVAWLREQEQ